MSPQARAISVSSEPPSLMTYRSQRVEAHELEAGGLWVACRDVEALDGIPRTSLDEVVDGRDHDQVLGARRDGQTDVAEVRAGQEFRLGQPVERRAFAD